MKRISKSDLPTKVTPPEVHRHRKILDASEKLYFDPELSYQDKAYTPSQLVQATLPHGPVKGNPPIWAKQNGNFTLTIRPGYRTNLKTGEQESIGYPCGTKPRLIIFWATTEVVRIERERLKRGELLGREHRRLFMGDCLAEFMRELGLNPENGGRGSKGSDRFHLHHQADRLFSAIISFEWATDERRRFVNMQLAEAGDVWWNPKTYEQTSLWPSWIELGERFYEALSKRPIPVDIRTLAGLKNSALALDLYAFLAYRCHSVNEVGKPTIVPLKSLQEQLGTGLTSTKIFGQRVREAHAKLKALYRNRLRVEIVRGALLINPGSQLLEP